MDKNYQHLIARLDDCRDYIRVAALATEGHDASERPPMFALLCMIEKQLAELINDIDEEFHSMGGLNNG